MWSKIQHCIVARRIKEVLTAACRCLLSNKRILPGRKIVALIIMPRGEKDFEAYLRFPWQQIVNVMVLTSQCS